MLFTSQLPGRPLLRRQQEQNRELRVPLSEEIDPLILTAIDILRLTHSDDIAQVNLW